MEGDEKQAKLIEKEAKYQQEQLKRFREKLNESEKQSTRQKLALFHHCHEAFCV